MMIYNILLLCLLAKSHWFIAYLVTWWWNIRNYWFLSLCVTCCSVWTLNYDEMTPNYHLFLDKFQYYFILNLRYFYLKCCNLLQFSYRFAPFANVDLGKCFTKAFVTLEFNLDTFSSQCSSLMLKYSPYSLEIFEIFLKEIQRLESAQTG